MLTIQKIFIKVINNKR